MDVLNVLSLSLAGDWKDIWSQKLTNYLMECIFPPLIFLHHFPVSCLGRKWWNGVEEDNGAENLLTHVHLEGYPLNWHRRVLYLW